MPKNINLKSGALFKKKKHRLKGFLVFHLQVVRVFFYTIFLWFLSNASKIHECEKIFEHFFIPSSENSRSKSCEISAQNFHNFQFS